LLSIPQTQLYQKNFGRISGVSTFTNFVKPLDRY